MQTAADKQKLDDLLTHNREFHFTIYRASGRRHLLQLIEQLWDLSTRYAHLQLHMVPDRAAEALYEIRSIVAACKRKDADAVGLMIRYKVHQTTTGLLQHMSLPETVQTVAPAKTQAKAKGRTNAKTLAKKSKAKPKKSKAKAKAKPKAKAKAGTKPKTKAEAKSKAKAKPKTVRKGQRKASQGRYGA
jgi:hypothetical protein